MNDENRQLGQLYKIHSILIEVWWLLIAQIVLLFAILIVLVVEL